MTATPSESLFDGNELNLSEEESLNIIDRLKKGPNKKAKKFIKKSIKFYKEMKQKEKEYMQKREI